MHTDCYGFEIGVRLENLECSRREAQCAVQVRDLVVHCAAGLRHGAHSDAMRRAERPEVLRLGARAECESEAEKASNLNDRLAANERD